VDWTKEGTGIKDAIDGLKYCTLEGGIVHWEQEKALKTWKAQFTAQSMLGSDKRAVKDFLEKTRKAIDQAADAGDARIQPAVCKEVIGIEKSTELPSLSHDESSLRDPIGNDRPTHNVPTQNVASHDASSHDVSTQDAPPQDIPTHDPSTEDSLLLMPLHNIPPVRNFRQNRMLKPQNHTIRSLAPSPPRKGPHTESTSDGGLELLRWPCSKV